MYIETVPNRNSPPAILLREGWREGGKVKKRTLANLSKWPPTLIEGLRVLLKGGAAVSRLDDAFDIVRSKPHGHVAAVLGTLRKLRLDRTIAGADSPERRCVLAMIVARILDPGSKLATARGLAEATARDSLAETLGLEDCDEDDLYAAMDWLLKRQDAIERRLAKRHLKDGALVLYDLTSVWLEGRRCPLGRRGYSRDGKRGKLQIEFGLLCDGEGRPVAVRVFAGNTADPATVGAQIDKLRHRFGFSRGGVGGRPRDVDRGAHPRGGAPVRSGLDQRVAGSGGAVPGGIGRGAASAGSTRPTWWRSEATPIRASASWCAAIRCWRRSGRASEKSCSGATEALLDPIVAAARREKRRLKGADKIGVRAGKVVGKYKMAKHLRSGYRRGLVRLSAKARVHRRRSGAGRLVRRAHQLGGDATRRRGRRARLQAPERGRARLPKLEDRGPEGAARVPPNRRPGPRARVAVHAGLLRGMAHARPGSSRCCSTTTTRPPPRPRAHPSWRRRRSPTPPRKKARGKRTANEHPVHSFRTLLGDLGTITKNRVVAQVSGAVPFEVLTRPTALQREVFMRLGVRLERSQ